MEKFIKQIYEEFTITTDFSKNMATDETIINQSVSVIDYANVDVTTVITDQSTIAAVGQTVQILVRAGDESGTPYKITFRCETSEGHKWELDIQMKIKEV